MVRKALSQRSFPWPQFTNSDRRVADLSLTFDASGGYPRLMRLAFKEWAVIADALLRGEQILIFRKGGLREGPGGFQPEHPEFLLFPTLFHQQRQSVVPSAQARYDALAPGFPASNVLRVEGLARVMAWQRL